MTAPIGQQIDSLAGRTSTSPFITIFKDRAPTGNDGINNGLQVGQRWVVNTGDLQATITGITNSNPAVITAANSFQVGQIVSISGVAGMTQINNFNYVITASNASSFTISLDTSTYGIYTSGGIATVDLHQEYILANFRCVNGFVQANWVQLGGSGAESSDVESITATSPLIANGVSGTPEDGPVTLSFSNSVVDGVLVTNNTGVASFLPNSGTPGYVLTANSAAPPSWQTNASGFSAASITVSPIAGQGNFTTITAALAAAVSGQDILIKAGTYTENLTLKAGVNLVAWEINSDTPIVTVIGKFSYSAAGTCSISGIRLQTNSDFLLEVTGSSASIVNLKHCYLNCTNNTGINFSSSNGSSIINIYDSSGNLTTTGITHYTSSSPGNLIFVNSGMANTGLSVVASNNSAGIATIANSSIQCPVSTSGTGRINIGNSQINRRDTNSVALTLNGTDIQTFVEINSTTLLSGTATAMIVGAGVDITAAYVTIESSNVNAIDGAGTLRYADLIFSGSSSKINTTTQVVLPSSPLLVHSSAGTPALSVATTGVVTIDNAYTLPTTVGTANYVLTTDGISAASWQPTGASAFGPIVIQTFTTTGTYTPTVGMVSCTVQVIGGGGAGGGATATGPTEISEGSGGGGGESGFGTFNAATIGASQAVVIGAGGIGNSGTTGGNGGNTNIGALLSANGGIGGTTVAATTAGSAVGGIGGTGGSGGNYHVQGQQGSTCYAIASVGLGISGKGGNSLLGFGGQDPTGITSGGAPGQLYGGGGSGGGNGFSQLAVFGGDGANGIVIITEYL